MSTLTYNGILLGDVQMLNYLAEPVYEGEAKTYVGTRYTLQVRGTYNPNTVAYTQTPPDGPVFFQGTYAPYTEPAIRHALSQPRQILLYQIAGQTVLRSPLPVTADVSPAYYLTDLEN